MNYCVDFLQVPQLVEGLADKEVAKIAAHPEGKHYLILTTEGDVYSWGNGDGGRLGHGDNRSVVWGFHFSLLLIMSVM